jgi:hypothetical protein
VEIAQGAGRRRAGHLSVVVEREGGDKPAMVAEAISRHYF